MACKDVRLIRLVDLGPIDVPRFFELQDRFQLLRDERLVKAGGKGLWVLHRSGACQARYANCWDPSKRRSVPRDPSSGRALAGQPPFDQLHRGDVGGCPVQPTKFVWFAPGQVGVLEQLG